MTPLDSPTATARDDRAADRLAWVRATLGDASLTLQPASADASFRSYWRTVHDGQSWIVMDSPPALEDPQPWLEIGARLHHAGLHVPAVRAHDAARGLLLIEDLGSRLYLPALRDGDAEALYGAALDALARMQGAVPTDGMAPYDEAFLRRELAIMPEWFLGRHLGHTPDAGETRVLDAAFDALLQTVLEQPRCFVHRDFHSRNLLLVDHAAPATDADTSALLTSPGIIDFQGALVGPLTYDLASLLRDCYIAWDDARVYAWVESYRVRLHDAGLLRGVDRAQFQRWFDLTGLQRHLKVLGIFCRLWYRDGKRGYLDDLPRVLRYVLGVSARYPELAALRELIERAVGDRDLTAPTA